MPGSGKTTALRALAQELIAESYSGQFVQRPFLHTRFRAQGQPPLFMLGAFRRDGFGGTDSLPFNVQPKVVKWLRTRRPPYTLGEGDRLANDKFFKACAEFAEVRVLALDLPETVAAARRDERGSAQDAEWLKGRVTKVQRLTAAWCEPTDRLDATATPAALAAAIKGACHGV